MAHPNRKLKDLAQSKTLTFAPKLECIKSHKAFAALYQDLEQNLKAGYQKEVWLKRRDGYIKRLRGIAAVTLISTVEFGFTKILVQIHPQFG